MIKDRILNMTIATVAVGVILSLAAMAGGSRIEAQSQSQGAILAGTWLGNINGLSTIDTYHQDGTFVTMRSHEFGGSPRPGMFRSNLRGSWRQAGSHFESVGFSFNFDGVTGEAIGITRIRSIFALDPGFETYSGEFYVAQWTCPTSLSCPDPLSTAPDVPEFVGATFSSRRVPVR